MPDNERIQKLHAAAIGSDKAEITVLHNAVLSRITAYQKDSTAAALKDWQAAKAALAETVDRLWPKYFPAEATRVGGDALWFKDKASAFHWYCEQGGQRQKSSFYTAVPAEGKKVSRLAVSEMLRRERQPATSAVATDLAARREDADTRKAEADAAKSEMQAEEMRRELDAKWVPRETADEETCVWVSRLRDAIAYHLGKNQLAIIHACGGDPARLSEVQSIIDAALAAASNEIANSAEITVEIEDLEDQAEAAC